MRGVLFLVCFGLLCWLRAFAAEAAGSPAGSPLEVEWRGHVVCLAEEMERLYGADLPSGHPHLYGFKSADGQYVVLLRNHFSEALFSDPAAQKKQLIVRGRIFPKTRLLEVTGGLRSIHDGKLYDLFYWCDVCSIRSVAPGPCMCCQKPVHLKETEIGPAPK